MITIILLILFSLFVVFLFPVLRARRDAPVEHSEKYDAQMKKLWSVAQTSMRERKPLRAEKALLTILKFDEKNAAAYNRLGIIYAKSQKYDEAIECFEIAQSLDSNASSLHNVGLIYLETGAYEKAAMAFRQALELEGDLPARFIALAKAEEKLGRRKAALEALENAFELDNNLTTLRQILALHEAAGDTAAIAATTARIEQYIAEQEAAKAAKKAAPARRRVVRRTASTRRATATTQRTTATTRRAASPTVALPKKTPGAAVGRAAKPRQAAPVNKKKVI